MPEAIARLSLLLAVVASVVCAFGIFSVLNRRVEASSKDIAVRKALGASAWHVITSVGKRDFLWAVGGVLIGVILSLVAGRHFFEVTNLRAVEVVAAPLIGASGVLLAAAMGATVPIARALAASTASLLRGE
jgi:ABC-type antimicrobial peptide transport system permease subunit